MNTRRKGKARQYLVWVFASVFLTIASPAFADFCDHKPSNYITSAGSSAVSTISAAASVTGPILKGSGVYAATHATTGATILGGGGGFIAGTMGTVAATAGAVAMSPAVIIGGAAVFTGVVGTETYCFFAEE